LIAAEPKKCPKVGDNVLKGLSFVLPALELNVNLDVIGDEKRELSFWM